MKAMITTWLAKPLETIGEILARLAPREQRLVAVFGALLAAVLGYQVVVEPLVGGRRRLAGEIESLGNDLAAMESLADSIRRAASRAPAETTKRELDKDFSLFSFVDRVTAAAVDRESVTAMTPTRRKLDDGTEETMVELKLARVSLAETVALLRDVQNASQPVYVKRFDLRKRYDDRSRFDVVMVAAALARP